MDDGAEPTKLFVGQIPREMKEDDLKQYFDEFGPISEVSIIRDNATMMSRGCAFVTFLYMQSALVAIESLHDQMKLPYAINPLQVRLAETQVERENKLFIGMLPKTVNEQDLHNMFHIYGELREVHIIRGPEGSPKGCAFVKYVDREAAIAAIEDLHDTIPLGATRPLVVKFADTRKAQGRNGGAYQQPLNFRGGRPTLDIPFNQHPDDMHHPQQHYQQQQQHHHMYSFPNQLPHQQMLNVPYGMHFGGPASPQHLHSPLLSPLSPVSSHPMSNRFMYMTSAGNGHNGFFPSSPGPTLATAGHQLSHNSSMGSMSHLQQQQILPPHQLQPHLYEPVGPQPQFAAAEPVGPGPGGPGAGVDHTGAYGPPLNDNESGFTYQHDNNVNPGASPVGYGQQPEREPNNHLRPPEGPSGANLFIYHLPRDLTDADLATLFAPFGNVISAKVFVDKKTADSKGFGFVSYDTLSSADAAIESMNGFQIGSKRLKVQHKRVAGYSPQHQHHPAGARAMPQTMQFGAAPAHISSAPYSTQPANAVSLAVESYYGPAPRSASIGTGTAEYIERTAPLAPAAAADGAVEGEVTNVELQRSSSSELGNDSTVRSATGIPLVQQISRSHSQEDYRELGNDRDREYAFVPAANGNEVEAARVSRNSFSVDEANSNPQPAVSVPRTEPSLE